MFVKAFPKTQQLLTLLLVVDQFVTSNPEDNLHKATCKLNQMLRENCLTTSEQKTKLVSSIIEGLLEIKL
jgi:hypothetical protein